MNNYPMHMVWSNSQILQWQNEVKEALEPIKLATWFLSFSPDAVVGYARDICRCPVRNYLQDVVPHLDGEVGLYQIKTSLPWRLFQHGRFKGLVIEEVYYLGNPSPSGEQVPCWLTNFIAAIDQEYCYESELGRKISSGEIDKLYTECDFPVTGEQALSLLQYACPELLTVQFFRCLQTQQIIKGVKGVDGRFGVYNPINRKTIDWFTSVHFCHYWEVIPEAEVTYIGLPS